MKKYLLVAAVVGSFSSVGLADSISTNAQCVADGLKLRQIGGSRYHVRARLNLRLTKQEEGVALSYVGHLETTYGDIGLELADYYGIFVGRNHISGLSPRATVYTDDKFYRFRELWAAHTTTHDGGGMGGYLVVSKQYFDREVDTFPAHFVFQSGDHMGGTVDFVCYHD